MIARLAPALLLVACGGASTSAPTTKHASSPSSSSSGTPTPIDAVPMLGPFADEGKTCEGLVAACSSANGCTCATDVVLVRDAMLFVTRDRAVPGRAVSHVALRTSGGWFAAADGPESSIDPSKKEHVVVTARGARSTTTLHGVEMQIAFDFVEVTIGPSGERARASVVLCGVGASKKPSCFDPIRGPSTEGEPPPLDVVTDESNVYSTKGQSLLVAAGNFTIHQEIPLEGAYLLRLP